MGGVAVQQDDLALVGMEMPVPALDLAVPPLHMHDEEAVQGGPAQAVAGEIAEVSGDERIEEQILRLGAGRIDIRI